MSNRVIRKPERKVIEDHQLTIWVDADACPRDIRDLILRTSNRRNLQLIFVANQSIPVPKSPLIQLIVVRDGADVADNLIADQMLEYDIVITQDIPLAAKVVAKNGVAIGPRGELFDDKTVHSRLASRDLMEQFRSAGMETKGPKPLNKKDIQSFANALDKSVTKCLKHIHKRK